jgi:hypothetical protein
VTYFISAQVGSGVRVFHARRECRQLVKVLAVNAVDATPPVALRCSVCARHLSPPSPPEPPILITDLPTPVLTASLLRERTSS